MKELGNNLLKDVKSKFQDLKNCFSSLFLSLG